MSRPGRRWEYAAHIRDLCAVMAGRINLILAKDAPTFPNWDQDETALAKDYPSSEPGIVAAEIPGEAVALVAAYAGISGEQWERTGVRSDGSAFTAYNLGVYALHDLEHHLWDVGAAPA